MKKIEESLSNRTTTLISDSFGNRDEKGTYEVSFRRWVVREIESGRTSIMEVVKRFNLHPIQGSALVGKWCKKYGGEIGLSLPVMSEKEKQKIASLQKRLQELEKQLQDAQMKNVALETLIDVAEEDLHISIRKKSGAGQ